MKKLFLLFAVATMSLSIYSCRETTEENTEDAMESAGDNIENAAEETGDAIENTAEEAEQEINEDDNM
jgi:predicted small secreted protein